MNPFTEYEPLLGQGFHELSLKQLEVICVSNFPNSEIRLTIFNNIKGLFSKIEEQKLSLEIWLNGSFLTKKLNPNDCDLVTRIPQKIYEGCNNTQLDLLNKIKNNLKKELLCDSYLYIVYPHYHTDVKLNDHHYNYWKDLFGKCRNRQPKGIGIYKTSPKL
jgi:hypothetical protein